MDSINPVASPLKRHWSAIIRGDWISNCKIVHFCSVDDIFHHITITNKVQNVMNTWWRVFHDVSYFWPMSTCLVDTSWIVLQRSAKWAFSVSWMTYLRETSWQYFCRKYISQLKKSKIIISINFALIQMQCRNIIDHCNDIVMHFTFCFYQD